jgi:hypothetical protein
VQPTSASTRDTQTIDRAIETRHRGRPTHAVATLRDDGGAATPSNRLLRVARAAAYPLKLHRTTGAVEASLLIVAAALAVTAGWGQAESALAIYFLVIAAIVAVGHVLSIVSSRRLAPLAPQQRPADASCTSSYGAVQFCPCPRRCLSAKPAPFFPRSSTESKSGKRSPSRAMGSRLRSWSAPTGFERDEPTRRLQQPSVCTRCSSERENVGSAPNLSSAKHEPMSSSMTCEQLVHGRKRDASRWMPSTPTS